MENTQINPEIVKNAIELYNPKSIGEGKTRIIRKIVETIEHQTGEKYICMEIGEPGIIPSLTGFAGGADKLSKGVSFYPPADGLPVLKNELSRFVKLFLDIDIAPEYCIPTVGAINGSYAAFMVAGRRDRNKETVLFIDPGFTAHKAQVRLLGLKQDSFDVYEYRGQKLNDILTKKFEQGNVCIVLYSNPNNPTWMCLTNEELKIIANLSQKYDVIPLEDQSYFPMDFRTDYSHPGQPPYQPTIAKYTDKYILMLSSSKSFSYAGERVAAMFVSENLYESNYPDLKDYYTNEEFGDSLVIGTILLTTGGVAQSIQIGYSEILKRVNDGDYQFVEELKAYRDKCGIIKKIFLENGFNLVYEKDGEVPIGDGFYFTVSFPGFSGAGLSERLLYYGISTLPLTATGSIYPEGIRICVSIIKMEQIPVLEQRLKLFKERHPIF